MSTEEKLTRSVGKQLYIERFGQEAYDSRIDGILPPEEDPRKWSLSRRVKEWFRFQYWLLRFTVLFSLGTLIFGRRMTHTVGIAGKGKFLVNPNPAFIGLPIFQAGKQFNIKVRQADASYFDNAACVVRSCSVKFFDDSGRNVLDILMNSGATAILWNIPSFLRLTGIRKIGETSENLKNFFKADPLATELVKDNMYRIDTLTDLSYYSKIRYLVKDGAGRTIACQFRCVPNKPAPEGRISVEVIDKNGQWRRGRFADDDRPWNYLHQEYEKRIAKAPVEYILQVQQKEVLDRHHSFSRDMYYCNAKWEEPWFDVGTIRVQELIDGAEARKLSFNIAHRPAWLKLPKSYSIDDYCSIAAFRTRVYPRIQPLRHLSYFVKKIFGKAYHYNHKTDTPPTSDGTSRIK